MEILCAMLNPIFAKYIDHANENTSKNRRTEYTTGFMSIGDGFVEKSRNPIEANSIGNTIDTDNMIGVNDQPNTA